MTNTNNATRRDFLAASAVGLVALARGGENLAWGAAPQRDTDLLYAGTYTGEGKTDGIHLIRLDRVSGKLEEIGSVESGANPSFLAIHPNGRVLYAVNETAKYNGRSSGAVSSFEIATETGALTRRSEQASEGAAPCYVSIDRSGKVVFVANYSGGNVALLPLESNGTLSTATDVEQHTRTGPSPAGREAAHAHCIVADPTNRFVLAADLGLDRVFMYRLDVENKSLRRVEGGDAIMHAGAGPRHIAFHSKLPLVFVANELDSTVTTLRFDAKRGALSELDTRSTLPPGWTGKNFPGDIHIAPSGRTLYVSNRGHNSIAVFSVAKSTGALKFEQVISTGGDWPRNFTLDPTGRWLLVANQRSDSVVVLARDEKLDVSRQRANRSMCRVRFVCDFGRMSESRLEYQLVSICY